MYGDYRLLPLDSKHEFLLLYINDHVLALEVSGYFDCDVHVADLLGPFVGEGCLYFCLFCAGCRLFGRGWLWEKDLLVKAFEG